MTKHPPPRCERCGGDPARPCHQHRNRCHVPFEREQQWPELWLDIDPSVTVARLDRLHADRATRFPDAESTVIEVDRVLAEARAEPEVTQHWVDLALLALGEATRHEGSRAALNTLMARQEGREVAQRS